MHTSTSTGPRRFVVSSTRWCSASFEEMLAATAIALPAPCLALIAAATCSQGPSLRDEITTFAPCSAILSPMALPMPREEPVITATLPLRENKLMSISKLRR